MPRGIRNRAVSSSKGPDYTSRLKRLRARFDEAGIDGLIVSSRENVRYLLGFAGSAGWILVTRDESTLLTDSRYIEHARATVSVGKVHLTSDGLVGAAAELAASSSCAMCGFEADNLTHAVATRLHDKLESQQSGCRLQSTEGIVDRLRMTKDEDELRLIQQAAILADGAVEHVRAVLRPGMTELQTAWEVEKWLRENGSGSIPFDIIAASGPNSALPHSEAGPRELQVGDPIVFDLGARVGGYCSDLSRTLFLGEPGPEMRRIYDVVLKAQRSAMRDVRSGMSAAEADGLARAVIAAEGYGDYFGHGLGHGVGLAIHECPAVSARSTDTLEDMMVFTVEPGIYVPGVGGVRIEDTVVLRDGSAWALTRADKDDPVVPLPW